MAISINDQPVLAHGFVLMKGTDVASVDGSVPIRFVIGGEDGAAEGVVPEGHGFKVELKGFNPGQEKAISATGTFKLIPISIIVVMRHVAEMADHQIYRIEYMVAKLP